MADPASIQESGGGEGKVPAQTANPIEEMKPVHQIKTEPADIEAVPEIKSEPIESKPDEPTASNTETAARIPEAEIKVEVKTAVEVKTNDEAKTEIENKTEIVREEKQAVDEVKGDKLSHGDAGSSGDWQQRELALLKKIQELEQVKKERTEGGLKMQLKVREEEIDLLKARLKSLETELQAALSKPGSKNHEMIENIKQQHEELLSKARGMIFDKTKMVKNQELQIEALMTQVQSLKDINQITKDLLEIRNSEIKAMEDRLHAMEDRFKKEKERYGLVLERAQTSSNINDDLKKEYEMQLKIFKELRTKYEQKVEALVAENNKLKLDLARGGVSGASTGAPK